MNIRLIAATALFAMTGVGQAQVANPVPVLGMLCPDGTDPSVTGVPCIPIIQRNAIDEGRASTTLPQTPEIQVPNDPLGRSIGNGDPGIGRGTGFGNPAIQLQDIN